MGKLLNKSATCSDASSADSSTVAWKDALISGRCPVELYFQPPASACGISPPGPGRSLFLFSSIWSWEGGLWYWLDWVLNPAPATYAACQQGTSFSGFRFLLYEMGQCCVLWGDVKFIWDGECKQNTEVADITRMREANSSTFSPLTHPSPCHPRLIIPILSSLLHSEEL